MASLADVFTDQERTNWLKAWLAIDIAKSGLEQFAENEAKVLHVNIYNTVLTGGAVACFNCQTANVLKCPSPGICNKRGANSVCKSMHDHALKQPRPCPANVCNKVLVEISKQHKFSNPSWKNTFANDWASNPWQIAKVYLPPDGYTGKSSVRDTDFNGIISFMMNCKHFDNKFSFPIASGKTHLPCILTKARDIGRTVRHTSTCKVTDTDLHDIFITLTSLLTDPQYLANDVAAQEAVRKLAQLQTDGLKLTTKEIVDLLEAAQVKLHTVENITEKAIDEMRIYIDHCRKDLSAHKDNCKKELDEHTGKCKEEFDEHRRKSAETDYEQSCKDFLRRLMAHYNDTYSNVSISNLDQSLDKPLADIYATPKIHRIEIEKNGKHVQKDRVLTYKDIFYTDDKSNRRIYLQGEPGRGKSTFSANLVNDWSNRARTSSASDGETKAFYDVFTLQKFKFLFLVTLRNSRGQTEVTQMIKKQLIDTTFSEDERADVYKLFVQIMKTEVCLVVREGLDEWVSPDGSNLAEPSMAGFQTETSTILTTSRPWKLADERIKNSQIDSLLEIEGISDPYLFSENILRCITDQTEKIHEIAEKFESFVIDRELESLSSSPMLFTLVICTWINTIDKNEHLKESSLCALYTTLLESLCKKANSATGYFNDSNPPPVHCFSSTSYIQPNIEHLDKLAEVACKLLLSTERESSIVFNDITLSNYFSQDEFTIRKTFALKAGILTNRKDKSRTGSSNSFVHKTVQELLAAYHIARNPNVIDDVVSTYLKLHRISYLELSQVLIFVCGMNISAANKLSALMDQYDVPDLYDFEDYDDPLPPPEFQKTIESGIREAAANNLDGKQLKLSHFYINKENIKDVSNIWSTNTFNAKALLIGTFEKLSSTARGEPTSHFEFNLSSCHKLERLYLSGSGLWLGGTASSATSEFPVLVLLNSADLPEGEESPPVLRSMISITMRSFTCSSVGLRCLLSTLLTLDHEVHCDLREYDIKSCANESHMYTNANMTMRKIDHDVECDLDNCDITSSEEGSLDNCDITSSEDGSRVRIMTASNNRLTMRFRYNECPGLWETLHSLNIKRLNLIEDGDWRVNNSEFMSKSLLSLTQLETLKIKVTYGNSRLWKAIYGLNIMSLSLGDGMIVSHVKSLSRSLSSLTKLETLSISFHKDSPGLWEALRGLNIKSLKLRNGHDFSVNHVESLSQCLSSLTQLETLSISVCEDNPDLWGALRGLHIKSLRLGDKFSRFTINHVESLSQSLSLLIELETLRITVSEDSRFLWKALHGLNVKSLRLGDTYYASKVKYVKSLSQSLSSLSQLEMLSIGVSVDSPGLFEILNGLNIKSLSLRIQWDSLKVNTVQSLSQSLSSLKQLETLTICVYTYIDLPLPKSLKYLNMYCRVLHPSEFRDLLNIMCVCTLKFECKLEFGCASSSPLEEYIGIKNKLEEHTHLIVKRFRIYDMRPGLGDIGIVNDDDLDYYDNTGLKALLGILTLDIINRISMRFQIIPALI
ncbi:hypothetical protein DPMN_168898 [Dreissena polymorpha]|uniref:NACHT domain-containing protein n=1 Tax=Dreissena polymorpha TaxID=45954 RepID=A0A9D4F610_DREPO|nr:hypothetical protein DPMN_168898 [Dreissena polymorpha]